MAKALEISSAQKAHLDFSFKCLYKLMEMTPMKDFAFSPDCIYEGLMMVYRASTDETKEQLKKILKLPIHLGTKFWAMDRIIAKNNKEQFNPYFTDHSCWINSNKFYRNNEYLTPEKCILFDCFNTPNLISEINEVLRKEMQMHIPQPVEFNSFNNNMEFILSYAVRMKHSIYERNDYSKPSTYISHELNMFMTERHYKNETSLITLFPAVEQELKTNNWKVDENISGLIERLTTEEGINAFYKLLTEPKSRELLPERHVIHPDFFELEQELPIDQLLEVLNIKHVLSPESATLLGFTKENLHLGGAKHHTYISITSKITVANAINIFFTDSGGTLTSIQEPNNHTECKNSFIWLIFNKRKNKVIFIGVVNKHHQRGDNV